MKTLFFPKSIAVFGVSETKNNFGKYIVRNLQDFQFQGKIFAIGKEEGSIYGLPIYKSILDVPDEVESAIFLVPSKAIPPMLEDCGKKGVKRAVISSGGFTELSGERKDLENEVLAIAAKYGIRFIGPNCLGLINQDNGMCLPFVRMARFPSGPVALFTQSGGVGLGLISLFTGQNLGINKYVSLGNKLNIGEPELMRFLETDESTKSVCLYLEEIERGREFVDAVRHMTKPIVAYKANTTAEGAKMAASHTAAIANDDKVVDAAMKQVGVVRVKDMNELPTASKVFCLPPMKGNRIAVITPTGGHAVIIADECERLGFTLPQFPDSVITEVQKHVRAGVIQLKNPLDLGDMFDFELMGTLVMRTLKAAEFDALVLSYIFLSNFPTAMIANIFPMLDSLTQQFGKPIALCLTGNLDDINKIRQSTKFPIFDSPDQVMRALAMLRDHSLNSVHRSDPFEFPEIDGAAVNSIVDKALADGRTELTSEATGVLRACGIPIAEQAAAATADEAAKTAVRLGFPIAMKIASPDILHKTEAKGVALGLDSEDAVRAAFAKITAAAKERFPNARIDGVTLQTMITGAREMLLGINYNEQFGHVIAFGLGGIYVEAIDDVVMRVAPLTRFDAETMIQQIHSAKILGDFRGMGEADTAEIANMLLKLSSLVKACPRIRELDVNPLMVPAKGQPCTAVDARIIISKE